MTDVYEHNPLDHEDPLAGPTWMVGLLGALVLVIILLVLTALYYNAKADEVQDQVIEPVRQDVIDLHARQAEELHRPGEWVERQEQGQTVRAYVIPIERAMELVVEEADRGR